VNPQELLLRARRSLSVRVPAAAVRGGGGGGSDERANGGGGFGLTARPVGAYVLRGGDARWLPAVDVNRAILGAQLVLGILALAALRRRRR
jgi:hypothetical protein